MSSRTVGRLSHWYVETHRLSKVFNHGISGYPKIFPTQTDPLLIRPQIEHRQTPSRPITNPRLLQPDPIPIRPLHPQPILLSSHHPDFFPFTLIARIRTAPIQTFTAPPRRRTCFCPAGGVMAYVQTGREECQFRCRGDRDHDHLVAVVCIDWIGASSPASSHSD